MVGRRQIIIKKGGDFKMSKKIKNIRATKIYKTMDSYTACSIAEGFSGDEPTAEELNAAWQCLVDTGTCWHLQGWYGRCATDLIEQGTILPSLKSHKNFYGNTVPGTES